MNCLCNDLALGACPWASLAAWTRSTTPTREETAALARFPCTPWAACSTGRRTAASPLAGAVRTQPAGDLQIYSSQNTSIHSNSMPVTYSKRDSQASQSSREVQIHIREEASLGHIEGDGGHRFRLGRDQRSVQDNMKRSPAFHGTRNPTSQCSRATWLVHHSSILCDHFASPTYWRGSWWTPLVARACATGRASTAVGGTAAWRGRKGCGR